MATAAIRPALDLEVPHAIDTLARAGFAGDGIVRLIEYPRRSPAGTMLVAPGSRAAPDGVVCCASFGTTGWIGALGVVPGSRRRGLGTALTEAASDWLRDRGARSVLLYATEMGRPIYERLGFVAEGTATAWRGLAGAAPAAAPVRALGEADRPHVAALDREATGEDRTAVLSRLTPLSGSAVGEPGALRGWAVMSPWGSGCAVTARDLDAGLALLTSAARGPTPGTVIVPDANLGARQALRGWGFAQLNSALRMCQGERPVWHPEQQFGLFNLFWG